MPEEKKYPTPEVNLLSGDDLDDQTQGKLLKWALTWGRRVVVLTELVVILVFLSRFWLDTVVADQSDKITTKSAIVKASLESEKRFKNFATRLSKATTIENSASVITVYDLVEKLVPTNVIVDKISISTGLVGISGISDEASLSKLENAFRNSKSFSDINIDKISKAATSNQVSFSLKAMYVAK